MGMLDDILNDVGAEMGRLGTQGAAELAAALFGGNAFVQYGAGQQPVQVAREAEPEVEAPAVEGPGVEAPAVEPPAPPEPNRGMEL